MNEKEYYENKAFWTEEAFTENKEEVIRLKTITELLPDDVKNLLDVGCGNGIFLKYLEKKSLEMNMTGLERSKVAIENKVCTSEILEGSADEINFKDQSFDIITSLEVIEHLPFSVYEKTLQEFERVSSKYIVISVPYNEKNRLIECNYCACKFSPFFHLRSFDENKMNNLFKNFKAIKVVKIAPYKEYFVWDGLKNFWYSSIKGNKLPMPKHSICPQCGFNDKLNRDLIEVNYTEFKPATTKRNSMLSKIRSLTPKRTNYRWICGVYECV